MPNFEKQPDSQSGPKISGELSEETKKRHQEERRKRGIETENEESNTSENLQVNEGPENKFKKEMGKMYSCLEENCDPGDILAVKNKIRDMMQSEGIKEEEMVKLHEADRAIDFLSQLSAIKDPDKREKLFERLAKQELASLEDTYDTIGSVSMEVGKSNNEVGLKEAAHWMKEAAYDYGLAHFPDQVEAQLKPKRDEKIKEMREIIKGKNITG